MKTKLFLFTFLILLLVIPFMMRPGKEVKKGDEILRIISVNPEEVRYEFGQGFARWMKKTQNRNVKIDWVYLGGTSSSLRFIKSEILSIKKNKIATGHYDLFFGGGNLAHEKLASKKCIKIDGTTYSCLQKSDIPSNILRNIPKKLNGIPVIDPSMYWFGTALSGFGIICNKKVLNFLGVKAPKTWVDLANPKLKSWIGLGDPRQSGTAHMVFEVILQALGWNKGWKALWEIGANTRIFSRHGSSISQDVALGEIACGLTIDYYALSMIKKMGNDLIFILPKNQTIINPDPISVLSNAPHPKLAKLFIEYVLSEGQYLRFLPVGAPNGPIKKSVPVMPVRKDIYNEPGPKVVKLNPFNFKSTFIYNSAMGSLRWQILNDLVGSALIENHKAAQAVWQKRINHELSDKKWDKIITPIVSENEFKALAIKQDKSDPEYRSNLRLKWIKYYYYLYSDI